MTIRDLSAARGNGDPDCPRCGGDGILLVGPIEHACDCIERARERGLSEEWDDRDGDE